METSDPALLHGMLADTPWLLAVEDEEPGSRALVLTVDDLEESAARVAAEIAASGERLYRLEPRGASLEDVFVDLVEAGR